MLGGGLRLYALYQGLPDVVWVDGFKFVESAQHMVNSGELKPSIYQYPGFFTYLLAAIYKLTGTESVYVSYLIARLVSALSGIALIYISYLSGRRIGSTWGALLAAALTALSITIVTSSRIPVTDVIVTCFMAAGVYVLSRETLRRRDFVLAGVFLGLAVGTKFSGLYLAPFLVLAAILQWRRSGAGPPPWRDLVAGSLTALAVLVMTTPWIVPEFTKYWEYFQGEMTLQQFGQVGRVQLGFTDYLFSRTATWEQPWLGTSLLSNEGAAVLLAGGVAVAVALSTRFGHGPLIHALFVVLYLAVISRPGHLKAIRFLIPILPSLFILCGWIVEKSVAGLPRSARGAAAMAAGIILLVVPATKSVQYMAMVGQPLTNAHARMWILNNIQAHETVLVAPFFTNNLFDLTQESLELEGAGSLLYRMPGDPKKNAELTHMYRPGLIGEFKARGAGYFVANSYFNDAFLSSPENRRWFPQTVAAYAAFVSELERETDLVYSVQGLKEGRLGPDIHIYRIR
jgi:hypothetical protein